MNASLPNVVFVFADQWRAQATGFAGNPGVRTPNLDALAARSVNVTHAISGCPVCSPYRASLLTGQYPHTHGVFVNDVHLADDAGSIAKVFSHAGYSTGYIGKWHLDGRGRKNYIPPESRQGFDFWQVLECTHDYNASEYYAGNDSRMLVWDGYDAHAQTAEACRFIRARATEADPFLLFLSWGPPHAPYGTAPEEYRRLYPENDIVLRPNVPEDRAREARRDSAGYYAHCTALDDCVGRIMATIEQAGVSDETIFIFTSDHGDMLFSHGAQKKQQPYEESVRVPFLLHYPPLGTREVSLQIDAQDIMPTLLGLIGLDSPAGVQGRDMSPALRGEAMNVEDAVLLSCYVPFGQWQ
ncbi:MAG: sulfatase, partial [Candidatus Pacebacteria bacterium]|nr:sulfatase [Candidatus Paceibacterota bacterium]